LVTDWALLGPALADLPATSLRIPDLASLTAALDAGRALPEVVVFPCLTGAAGVIADAHAATARALALLQGWVADERLTATRLWFVTRGAIAAVGGDAVQDLGHAALWGLVRGAQSEHPDFSIGVLDLDVGVLDPALWSAALASPESQLAVRADALYIPRLQRCGVEAAAARPAALARLADGTVLITGGTGTLGALLAEHLVREYGAQHLLLCSRSGRADELQARLQALGASVEIAACDVSQRAELAALLAAIPAERPLSAVLHLAGVTEDGMLVAQDPQRFARVFQSKLDAAYHLHELTQGLDLAAFVLFSSLSGLIGAPGQSNYAAANSFLDALAQQRRARGLVGHSLCWGFWANSSGVSAKLSQADVERMTRGGLVPMSATEGLALFDLCLTRDEAPLVPCRLDLRTLERVAERLPAIVQDLVRSKPAHAQLQRPSTLSLGERLAPLSAADRTELLLTTINDAVSAVLRTSRRARIDPDQPLSQLGLDSLMAVELRNELATAAGVRLPSTLLFDHPSANALTSYLEEKLAKGKTKRPALGSANLLADVERLEALISQLEPGSGLAALMAERFDSITKKMKQAAGAVSSAGEAENDLALFADADDEQLFKLVEQSMGK
jgi:NAD(P)-dependent dehydrogenase (short-subunit alcohol dehydrogenase family)/acyl carrier protein